MSSVPIADLTIKITDNATQAATSVNSLADALERLGNGRSPASLRTTAQRLEALANINPEGLERLREALERMVEPAERLATALREVNATFTRINGTASTAMTQVTQTAEALQTAAATMTTVKAEMTSGMAGTGEGAEEAKESVNRFGKAVEGLTIIGKSFHNAFSTIMPNIVSQFFRLAKMRILRTIIKNLLAGFTEGLQNVYYWAKLTGNQFASSMDTIKTSLNYAKNSIGAAFAPVLNAVAPVIDKLVDLLVEGINYVNMFFAVLNGQSTYIRAKKVAVEYGNAVANSAGGAAAAVKELKAALTVLDFDELHQLQEATNPSSGGGGGGGAGGISTDYGSMFEEVAIPQNAVTNFASWILDNKKTIIQAIKEIGAAFLLWKFSNAFLNGISAITGLTAKQNLGLTIAITSLLFAYEGGKEIGKNGWRSLKGIIETAVAAVGAAAGLSMAFGATGLLISIPITFGIWSIGFAEGEADRLKAELEKESEIWNKASQNIQASIENIQASRDLYTDTLNSWESNITENENRFAVGEALLSMFRELSEKGNLDSVDLTKLQGIADAFNEMFADDLGITLDFTDINGEIQSNIDMIENLLEEYKKLAMVEGYYQFIKEASADYAEQSVKLGLAQAREEENLELVRESLGNLKKETGLGWADALEYYKQVASVASAMNGGEITLDVVKDALGAAANNLGINISNDETAKQVLESFQAITAWIESHDEVGVISDNLSDTEALIGEALKQMILIENEVSDIQKEKARNTSAASGATGLTTGATAIINALNSNAVTESVENAINSIDIDGTTLMSRLNRAMFGAIETTPFADTGVKIGNYVAGGSISGYNALSILTAYSNGLSSSVKSVAFDENGRLIGTELQNGTYLGYDADKEMTWLNYKLEQAKKSVDFSSNGKTIGSDITTGTKNGFDGESAMDYIRKVLAWFRQSKDPQLIAIGQQIGSALETGIVQETVANGASYVLYGLKTAINQMDFTSLGTNIAGQIKYGIANNLNNSTLEIATYSGTQVLNQTKGKVYASLYGNGGFPSAGSLFIAGEDGRSSELVGTINGRTGVANSDQIASAIAMAMKPLLAGGNGTQTTNVEVKLDSATIARASMKGQRAMNQQYNLTARA